MLKKLSFALTLLVLTSLSLGAQAAEVSLTFTRGFIGSYKNQPHSSITSLTLFGDACVERVAFVQNSTNGLFGGTQGNDLGGTLRVFVNNGGTRSRVDLAAALNWRDANGQTLHGFGFVLATGVNATWGCGAGSVTVTGGDTTLLLQAYESSKVFATDGSNVTGNASTSGLLDDLNGYLALLPAVQGVTITPTNATEGDTVTFTIALTEAETSATAGQTISYTFSLGGTATAGTSTTGDYDEGAIAFTGATNNGDGTFSVPPSSNPAANGVLTRTVQLSVPTRNDADAEGTETLSLTAANYVATASLADNDGAPDADNDGVADSVDNCPNHPNATQSDLDTDMIGDACDDDIDGDGVPNEEDSKPLDKFLCKDADEDTCDECASGSFKQTSDDGADTNGDGVCDAGDKDGDGITDEKESAAGTDPNDADSDDDGVVDGDEGPSDEGAKWNEDTDEDGLINALDPDSDNDGLFDGTEQGNDCSNDGTDLTAKRCRADADPSTTTNPLAADTDEGGVFDGSEDTNLDGKLDSGEQDPNVEADDADAKDSDGDGLSDKLEATLGSDPNDTDTDDDGVLDGAEANPSDDGDRDGLIDVLDVDSDDDGLLDGTERGTACDAPGTLTMPTSHCIADENPKTLTSMVNPDTDRGGERDGDEDSNLNGKVDGDERDPLNGEDDAEVVDSDGDGLSDALEARIGSNPNDADTDDDGVVDGDEANPSDDFDGDGYRNVNDFDSDEDGLFDGTERGKDCEDEATDKAKKHCVADADQSTRTLELRADTDKGGVVDGEEDTNHNGKVDPSERDPLDAADDKGCYVDADCTNGGVCNAEDGKAGQCVGCTTDSQCGGPGDGRVCVAEKCEDGCRAAEGGGSCGEGQFCTSEGDEVGQCVESTEFVAKGGWACSVRPTDDGNGGSLGFLVAAAATVFGLTRRRRRRAAAVASALVTTASLGTVSLQAVAQDAKAVQDSDKAQALDRFNPSWAGDRFFGVTSPGVQGDRVEVHGKLLMEYQHRPVVLLRQQGDVTTELGDVVSSQVLVHANATLALFNRVGLNISIPFATFQNGDDPTVGTTTFTSPSGGAVGDLRLGTRVRLLGRNGGPFQLGIGGYAWLPIGDDSRGSFMSNGKPRSLVQLSLGGTSSRFIWNIDGGVDVRRRQVFANVVQNDAMRWGAGLGVLLGERRNWQLGVESFGTLLLEEPSLDTLNAEVLGSVRWRFHKTFITSVAGGSGVTGGLGTPQARAMLSLEYSPLVHDRSKDRDGDGIPDASDACPDVAGLPSSDPSQHGCAPPLDLDGDGIIGALDACPNEPGPSSPDPWKNGCMRVEDLDQDGILDAADFCPEVAGVASKDPTKNGCPDADGDGIVDAADVCPKEPGVVQEDFPERNGCPLLKDSDSDKIADPDDACPKDPGEPSPDPKKNGCPKVRVTESEVVFIDRIEFDLGRSTIRRESDAILDAIGKVLVDHPELLLLEVQGHTDDQGNKISNKKLSQLRAEEVVKALTKRGVVLERLAPKGFGDEVPLLPNTSDANRKQNRRVQLLIVKKKPR